MRQEETRAVPAVEAREYARNRKKDDPEPYPHAGLVADNDARKLLDKMMQAWQPTSRDVPANAEDSKMYQELLAEASTDTLTHAVLAGNTPVQSFFAGDPDRSSDVSGLKAIQKLEELVCQPAPIHYIFGEPGTGKTDFALLLGQIWKHEYPDGEIGTNIRTLEEKDEWLPKWTDLEEWIDENLRETENGGIAQVDDAKRKIFIFDEANSAASGRGGDAHNVNQMLAPMVYQIRKARAGMVVIGHDGRDIHPAVRELATVFEKRRNAGKKTVWVWEDVRNRQGQNMIMKVNGLPATDWSFDSQEATSFEFDDNDENEELYSQEEMEKLAEKMSEKEFRKLAVRIAYETDITQAEVASQIGEIIRGKPYDQSRIPKWKKQLMPEYEP